MSVKRETATARRRLEFMLRCCVRLLARPGVAEKDLNQAINTMLERVGPAERETDVLAELVRRGEYVVADGYPAQSMADSDIHGGFAQTGSTSTERAALRWASPSAEEAAAKRQPVEPDDPDRVVDRDPAAEHLESLVTRIDAAATLFAHADRDRKFLLSIQWRQPDPEAIHAPTTCSLCPRVVTNYGADRLKSLYCPACYEAWRRAGAPQDPVERRRFETERLAKRQDRARVECPHVCCPIDTRRAVDHDGSHHFHAPEDCPSCAEVRSAEAS